MEAAPSTPLLPPFAADPEAGPFVSRRWMLSLYANIFFSSSYNARSFSNRAYHVGPTRVSMRTPGASHTTYLPLGHLLTDDGIELADALHDVRVPLFAVPHALG